VGVHGYIPLTQQREQAANVVEMRVSKKNCQGRPIRPSECPPSFHDAVRVAADTRINQDPASLAADETNIRQQRPQPSQPVSRLLYAHDTLPGFRPKVLRRSKASAVVIQR